MKLLSTLIFFTIAFSLFADDLDNNLAIGENYIFRLINGDLISGQLVEVVKNGDVSEFKVDTELGFALIEFSQIAEVCLLNHFYRQEHRYFFLPTAIGIGTNHYLALTELFFLNAGIGLTDYISIVLGRTVVPNLFSNQQLTLINLKGTLPKFEYSEIFRELYIALGLNLAFANHNNRFIHFYGSGTVVFYKTSLTTSLFYKFGSKDFYLVRFSNKFEDLVYEDGSFGLAIGLNTRLPSFRDLHFVAELWNINITKPTHTGVFAGVRMANTKISTDFGFAWFSQPFLVPFVNFAWTPF